MLRLLKMLPGSRDVCASGYRNSRHSDRQVMRPMQPHNNMLLDVVCYIAFQTTSRKHTSATCMPPAPKCKSQALAKFHLTLWRRAAPGEAPRVAPSCSDAFTVLDGAMLLCCSRPARDGTTSIMAQPGDKLPAGVQSVTHRP